MLHCIDWIERICTRPEETMRRSIEARLIKAVAQISSL